MARAALKVRRPSATSPLTLLKSKFYGRGSGVGCGHDVGILGVDVGRGVVVGLDVAVAVGVGLAVGVAVGVGEGGIGEMIQCITYLFT